MPPKRDRTQLLDELFVVLDVDGVTRRDVTGAADPAVVRGVKKVLARCAEAGVNVHVTFLSGSPVVYPREQLPEWCLGTVPLCHVFGNDFNDEIAAGRVSIFGQLGAEQLVLSREAAEPTLVGVTTAGFSHTEQMLAVRELVRVYHKDLEATDAAAFQAIGPVAAECIAIAQDAAVERDAAAARGEGSRFCWRAPAELEPWVMAVRQHFDPHFRLVSNGGTIEYHDFKTVGRTHHSELAVPQAHASSGIAHRDGLEFRFVILTKTNKGETVGRLVDERRSAIAQRRGGSPNDHELEVVTVGDTAIDYPMHELASTPFHVGIPAVWDAHDRAEVAHVALITRKDGSAPLVEGTARPAAAGQPGGLDVKSMHELLAHSLMIRETLVE